jgi:hypothetical protein
LRPSPRQEKAGDSRAAATTVCPSCGGLLYNTWRGALLPFPILLLATCGVVALLERLHWSYLLFVLLPLAPVGFFAVSAALAEPRAIQHKRKLCKVCHREDVRYFRSWRDDVCAERTERLERARVRAIKEERNSRQR